MVLLCELGCAGAQGRPPSAEDAVRPGVTRDGATHDVVARDLDGHAVHLLPAAADGRVVVLVFVASDCPISNRYLPELVRLRKAATAQKVAFWFVYPNLTETAAAIRSHQATYGATGNVLRDNNQALARLTGAKVTPEAAVLVRHGSDMRVVYTGRIDDRYLSIGNERPQATWHDLNEAIQAAVAGRPVAGPGGPPVGCGIVGTR